MRRPICGSCPDCMERTRRLLRVPARSNGMPGTRPSRAALEKHAKRFGNALVAETAAEYGVTVTLKKPERKPFVRGRGRKR